MNIVTTVGRDDTIALRGQLEEVHLIRDARRQPCVPVLRTDAAFQECGDLSPGHVTRPGVYVLSIAPAEGHEGRAPISAGAAT